MLPRMLNIGRYTERRIVAMSPPMKISITGSIRLMTF